MGNDIIPYQEVKLENQTVDEIVEDIGILKKIEEASKFEIGRRLVYLKETCKHGEYLPKLEGVGISRYLANEYINFFTRFANVPNLEHLGKGKIRELLRIPKGSEEEYLNKIPNPDEVTAKQLREEIDRLKQEKEQEKLAKDVLIKNNEELQRQLEREKKTKKTEYITNEVVVEPSDYSFIKDRLHELECNNKVLEDEKNEEIERLNDELDKYRQLDMCQQDVEDRLNRQVEIIEKLDREEEILESWGEVMGELDLIIAKINVVSRSTYSLNNKGENAIKKSALYCSNRLKEIYTYLDETFEPSTIDINCVEPEFECIEGE